MRRHIILPLSAVTGTALLLTAGCDSGGGSSRSVTTAPVNSSTTGNPNSSTTGSTSSNTTTGPGAGPGTGGPGAQPIGGTGVFLDGGVRVPTSGRDDWAVAAGDVDGDGDVDLVLGENGGGLTLLENDASSFTAAAGAFPALQASCTDARLVDFDGDGDLDLLLAGNFEPVRLYANDGAGAFTLQASAPPSTTTPPSAPTFTYAIGVGDLNGDNLPDVYMANSGQSTTTRGRDAILLNDGQGGLIDASSVLLPPGLEDDTIGVGLIDVEGDGDLDVMAANFGVAHRLLINDGQGGMTDATAQRLPSIAPHGSTGVAVADVDRDGDLDAVIANEGFAQNGNPPAGEPNTLLLNDGQGNFTDGSARLPGTSEASFAARLVDVDGDQWPDLLVANLRGRQRLYLNAQGTFTDVTDQNLPAVNQGSSSAFNLAIGDFDGDRTTDVAFARRGAEPYLFLNIPR